MNRLRTISIAFALSVALNVTVFLLGGGNSLANSGPVTLRLVEGYKAVCTQSKTSVQNNRKLASTKIEMTIKVNSDHLIFDSTTTDEIVGNPTKTRSRLTLRINLFDGVPTTIDEVIKLSINGVDFRSHSETKSAIKLATLLFPFYGITLSKDQNVSKKELLKNNFIFVESGNDFKVEQLNYFIEKISLENRTITINQKLKLRLPNEVFSSAYGPWKIDLNTGLPISKKYSHEYNVSGVKLTGETIESCSISRIKGYSGHSNLNFDQRIENQKIQDNHISLEARLSEVMLLLNEGLISEDEASEKRRQILGLEKNVRVNPSVASVEESYTLSCRANKFYPEDPFSRDVIEDLTSGSWDFSVDGKRVSTKKFGETNEFISPNIIDKSKMIMTFSEVQINPSGQKAEMTYQVSIDGKRFKVRVNIKNDRIDGSAGTATGLCEEQG